jgi:DNA-binding response OmpR family regulator
MPLSVLIVEDQPDVAESTAELLSLCGCETHIACGGEAALDLAATCKPFDLVILDLFLPGINGWEVARRVRKLTAGKQPFIIAMTGYSSEEARCHSAEAGIDIHLIKPVGPRVLIRLLAWLRELTQPQKQDEAEPECDTSCSSRPCGLN